jgi:hypothetical protein
MTRFIETLRTRTGKLLLIAAAGLGTLALPTIASAGDRVHDRYSYDRGDRYDGRDHRRDHRDHDRDRTDVRIDVNVGRGPVYEQRTERVWVEPVYRTVCERVWVEPVYRTEYTRVWIEPVYEVREVVRYGKHGRRYVERERVLVCPGRWEERPRQVLVCEGQWKTVERQELVSAGHWEYRTVRERAPQRPNWGFSFDWRK